MGSPADTSARAAPRAILLSTLLILVGWTLAWPFTGEGDAAMHYQASRHASTDPALVLSAWARPLYATAMIPAAALGPLAARSFAALLTVVLMWQTMRLASDLGLRHAALAGLLVIWQPLAFALASDTMTEIPMALGLVVAMRLWLQQRLLASCLWVSLLPLVRPEGFFIGVLWGAMVLFGSHGRRSPGRKAALLSSLLAGCATWVLACWVLLGDPLHFVENWSWPLQSYASYASGGLFDHVVKWPYYCGPVLLPLFLLGVRPSLRDPRMRVPWAVWAVVLGVHSVLWWGGWLGALGLMRIQVTSAATTALVCLFGWNAVEDCLREKGWRPEPVARTMGVLASLTVIAYYVALPQHHRCFPMVRAARHVQAHHAEAPRIIAGDEVVHAVLDLAPGSPRLVHCKWSREENLELIDAQPAGTIAVWDDQRGMRWRKMTIADFRSAGYERMHEETGVVPTGLGWPMSLGSMRYVVLKKASPRPGDARARETDGRR